MLLGVVSDTHAHVENARRAVRMLESLDVAEVIHCGDIGSAEVVPLFSQWPTHFVFGNVDYDLAELRAAIKKAKLHCHERFGQLQLAGRKIAFLHGDDRKQFDAAIDSQQFDLVCHGHTHIARQEQIGKTQVLNPGALYRANPHTLAVVDLNDMQTNIIVV
jgi:putative phosphoesterase